MSNFKRKTPKTKVRCEMCTPNRYGNSSMSTKPKYYIGKHKKALALFVE